MFDSKLYTQDHELVRTRRVQMSLRKITTRIKWRS